MDKRKLASKSTGKRGKLSSKTEKKSISKSKKGKPVTKIIIT